MFWRPSATKRELASSIVADNFSTKALGSRFSGMGDKNSMTMVPGYLMNLFTPPKQT